MDPGGWGAVAFSDVVGFTAFNEAAGDEAAVRVVDQLDDIVRKSVASEGRIVKGLGDGHLLWFPSARAAVAASLCIQRVVREDELGGGDPLWVRMGIHWGTPTWRGDDILGHDVNVAARVTDAAGAGEVVVTAPAREAVGDDLGPEVTFREIGPTTMKGLSEPIWLYRVQTGES